MSAAILIFDSMMTRWSTRQYTVQKLSTILQSVWSWQTQDFNMALNAEERATEQMSISLLIYMNYEPKLKENDKRG